MGIPTPLGSPPLALAPSLLAAPPSLRGLAPPPQVASPLLAPPLLVSREVTSRHGLKAGFPAFLVFRAALVTSGQNKTPLARGFASRSSRADQ